jgi:hypothetical protein
MMASDDGGDARGRARSREGRASERADAESSEELEEVKADLGALVAAHPVGALAAAVGVGYVVGGGLFTQLTSRLLRAGLRLGLQFAVLPALEHEVATLVGLGKTGNGVDEGPGGRERGH